MKAIKIFEYGKPEGLEGEALKEHAIGFCIGRIKTYIDRYNQGDLSTKVNDLCKIEHYALMARQLL